jgi:hypothetical protein
MNWLKRILNIFSLPDMDKSAILVHEYWRKDRERKAFEKRFVQYPSSHYSEVSKKLLEDLEKIGAQNIMIIAEKLEGPKIKFMYKDKEIISDEIFDFTYDKIMENIKQKITK